MVKFGQMWVSQQRFPHRASSAEIRQTDALRMAQTDERGTASLSDRHPMRQQHVSSRAKRTEQPTDSSDFRDDKSKGLTVAVTGPTGEIGISAVTALERDPAVERIIGMARRPFDPASHGWTNTTYQQGDIMDRAAVDALLADADVVIHLAIYRPGFARCPDVQGRRRGRDRGWPRRCWPARKCPRER